MSLVQCLYSWAKISLIRVQKCLYDKSWTTNYKAQGTLSVYTNLSSLLIWSPNPTLSTMVNFSLTLLSCSSDQIWWNFIKLKPNNVNLYLLYIELNLILEIQWGSTGHLFHLYVLHKIICINTCMSFGHEKNICNIFLKKLCPLRLHFSDMWDLFWTNLDHLKMFHANASRPTIHGKKVF